MRPVRTAVTGVGVVLMLLSPVAAAADAPPSNLTGTSRSPVGVVINEFAPSGPGGSTDEFLELHNTGSQVVFLNGWQLAACLSHSSAVKVLTFGGDDQIDPGGDLILAHVDWSGSVLPDLRYTGPDVPDDGGWLLTDLSGRSEGVGMSLAAACTEGDPASQCEWPAGEAVTRDAHGTDSDNNAADFTCQLRTPGG